MFDTRHSRPDNVQGTASQVESTASRQALDEARRAVETTHAGSAFRETRSNVSAGEYYDRAQQVAAEVAGGKLSGREMEALRADLFLKARGLEESKREAQPKEHVIQSGRLSINTANPQALQPAEGAQQFGLAQAASAWSWEEQHGPNAITSRQFDPQSRQNNPALNAWPASAFVPQETQSPQTLTTRKPALQPAVAADWARADLRHVSLFPARLPDRSALQLAAREEYHGWHAARRAA